MARTSTALKSEKAKAVKSADVKSVVHSPMDEIRRLYGVISARVVGQEEAKRVVASAIAIHQDRLRLGTANQTKSNVLIYGPTGSGKTEIIRTVVDYLKCPFVLVDASKLTPSGFIGEDATSFLHELIDKAGGDIALAETGIVMIDEVDKLAAAASSHEGSFQIRKVQSELLKIVEGQKITLKKKGTMIGLDQSIVIDTSRILFIAAGAFDGIDALASPKKDREISMLGAEASNSDKVAEPSQADFIRALCEFGLMPEFAGRFQFKARTRKLQMTDYISILNNQTVSTISGYYIEILRGENVELSLSDAMIEDVAIRAMGLGLGVRGIQSLVESRMVELLFDIENLKGKKVILEPEGHRIDGEKEAKRDISEVMKVLSESSFLVNLDRKVLSYICAHGKLVSVTPKSSIMKEGDDPISIMILLSGSVLATNKAGLNIQRNEIGSFFGEIGFLDGKKRTATLTAQSDCRLLELSSDALSDLIKQRPQMGVEVIKALSSIAISRVR